MITQKINLNLIPNGVMPRVNVSQYDYGSRTLEITLYNGSSLFTIPTGANVVIQGTKKDNRGFQYSNLEFSGSVVTADITQQMTVFEDEVQVELVIITGSGDNTQQLATANFILNVEPAALKSDIVISETDIPAIQTLPEAMEEVEAAVELIETVLPAIEGAEAWAVGTKDGVPVTSEDEQYHNNSKYYAEQASTSETNAGLSASAASGSATSASGSAEDAEAYGIGKRGGVDVTSGDVAYHNNSKYYAGLASNSANNASTSETNAGLSASAASGSATSASNNADESEAWATGEINGTPVASDKPQYHNSAKWWADQASQAAGGGVTSFNGRSGSVSPANGDYDITQIAPTSGATEGQVVVVNSNGDFTVDDAPSSGHTIKDSTTTFTQRDNLKFTGNVSVSDDSTNNATVVEVTDSGHEIINASGTSMTQRTGLQFKGLDASDDSVNGRTVVGTDRLDDNIDALKDSGAVNKLVYPYEDTTKVENGITYTDIGNGIVNINGTASGESIFVFNSTLKLAKGTYIVSTEDAIPSNVDAVIQIYNTSYSVFVSFGTDAKEATFTLSQNETLVVKFKVNSGYTLSNFVLKPMIRDARITDPTWVPFAMTNRELTESVEELNSNLFLDGQVSLYSSTIKDPSVSNRRFVYVPLLYANLYSSITVNSVSYGGTIYTDFAVGTTYKPYGFYIYSDSHTNIEGGMLVLITLTVTR